MTLDELLKDIDMHLPGNRFDNEAKTMWINEIEGKIFDELEKKTLNGYSKDIVFIKRGEKGWQQDDKKEKDPVALETEDTTHDYVKEIDPLNLICRCNGFINAASQINYELIPYIYPQDANTKLICPDRFADVYVHYVLAKMHAADSEINEYNNEVLLYDASYNDYAAWHIRNFRR